MIEIIPTIFPQNVEDMQERFAKVLGLVKKVQLDIVDGIYADNKTWPFIEGNFDGKIPFTGEITVQADLMISDPARHIPNFIEMGVKSFVIHIDSTGNLQESLALAKASGCEVGLAIKPSLPTALLDAYIEEADFVQFMGNDKVGHSGVDLDKNVLEKIKSFHEMHPGIPLQIDIGVREETIRELAEAGIRAFVSGSLIYGAGDIAEEVKKLQVIS